MANGIGQTKRKAILANLFTGGTLAAETAWYISLHTGDPGTDAGATAAANEVGGGVNYSRVNYTGGWTAPSSADPSVVTNSAAIVFPSATGSWSTITYAAIWNHASNTLAANFIARVLLAPPQAIASGNVATIPLGTLSVGIGVTP